MGIGQGAVEGVGVSVAMTGAAPSADFWDGKRVLLTGHTGFKGAWTATWLKELGALVTGFALAPDTTPALYDQLRLDADIISVIGDLRDASKVKAMVVEWRPDVVIHMAAQPIVRRAIAAPIETLSTNIMGTAHLLQAIAETDTTSQVLVITSDKVYANNDAGRAFTEGDALGGKDPYSASKAATELVVRSYAQTYLEDRGVRVATARGGNVVGGGDWAVDRIVPDIVRAAAAGRQPVLRMPHATRPWQHVLDCVGGYLGYVEALAADANMPRALNFGPVPGHDTTVGELTQALLGALGRDPAFIYDPPKVSKEMAVLAVDSSLARSRLGWRDRLAGDKLVSWTADWYSEVHRGADAREVTLRQIKAFTDIDTATS